MRKSLFFFLIYLSFCISAPARELDAWRVEKSTHFLVHYRNAPKDFIARIVRESEKHYNQIAQSLGYNRYDFWLWDKRARIYIYDNQKQYQDSMHGPDWSAGLALPREKIIHTYVEAPDFFAAILPHELGHIIFREFVGFNNSAIPLWLEEGLATYQENQLNIFHQAVFGKALRENRLFSLEELSNFDPTSSPDQERVEIYYAQAANIVEYLLKKMSRDKFVTFCRDLRERQDFLRALSRVYSFKDLSELETDWKGYLR